MTLTLLVNNNVISFLVRFDTGAGPDAHAESVDTDRIIIVLINFE